MMNENWLPVVGCDGIYSVSDLGRVRSEERRVTYSDGRKRRYPQRILTGWRHHGYLYIRLYSNGKPRKQKPPPRYVHHLVLEAFVGPCPPSLEACHANDIGDDNRLENLRWDTHSANATDKVRNGNHPAASKTHCPQGHAYSDVNTYRYPAGGRGCRQCRRDNQRRRRAAHTTIDRKVPA